MGVVSPGKGVCRKVALSSRRFKGKQAPAIGDQESADKPISNP
jgi:hypothetical protein